MQFRRASFVLAGLCALAAYPFAAAPQQSSDIPKTFTAPTAGYDYVRREVMIPMRDGVKLYTVIVIPKGRAQRAHRPHAHAVQRLEAPRAQR